MPYVMVGLLPIHHAVEVQLAAKFKPAIRVVAAMISMVAIYLENKDFVMLRLAMVTIASTLASHAALAGGVVTPTPVPEPISLSLLAVGVGGAVLYRRLRK